MIQILTGLFSLDQHRRTVVTFLTLDDDLSRTHSILTEKDQAGRMSAESLHGSRVIMKITHGVCWNLIIAILSIFFGVFW